MLQKWRKKSGCWSCALCEFKPCSHEYHLLLGSEVTGNFWRDCMRFARSNTPLCCFHTQVHVATLCQVTCSFFSLFFFNRTSLYFFIWADYGCSCVDHFIFGLTNYYTVIKFKTATTSRCFPGRVYISDWCNNLQTCSTTFRELIKKKKTALYFKPCT